MQRICAWCGAELGPSEGDADDGRVSHGICESCKAAIVGEDGIPLDEFLESLDVPTLLVSDVDTVDAANSELGRLLGDGPADGATIGEVFLCAFSEDEGCGLSVHCSGCTIRRSVAHTYETGEARSRIPATLRRIEDPVPQDLTLHISTVRVGDRVLLRIDPHPEPAD